MNDQYYKLPYAFFENDKYREMTSNEGYIYSVLYARYELSARNNDFHDEDGIFVYYTVRGLMNYINLSKQTVVNGLKHLEELGLITRKKGKTGQPDKVYVHEVEPAKKKEQRKIEYPELDVMFPGLEGLITSEEMKQLKGVIDNLVAEKRDVYKINGLNIVPRNILSRIMMLGTGDVVNIFFKMREEFDIENKFMYLMTSLYNASN